MRSEKLGSVEALQDCNESIGAEPEPLGSQAYIAVEWFLAWRGRGLPIESLSVRQSTRGPQMLAGTPRGNSNSPSGNDLK